MSACTSDVLRRLALAALLSLAALPLSAQQASSPAGGGGAAATQSAPAGFVAQAEPKADETNAQRAKTQPGNNAPFWRAVRESGSQEGVVNLPGAENGVLVQKFVQYPGSSYTNAGEAWRQVRNRWLIPYGGSLLLVVALALGLLYWRKGALGGHVPDNGRKIERFTPFERAAHWANAGAFVALAVSGLVMAFGKFLLLPVIGGTLFGWLTYLLKTIHNFAGPLFAVSLVIVFVTFVRDNVPAKGDLRWLIKGGGVLGSHEQVPSHRFNAGEKIVFWSGVFALGLIVIASGLVLDKLLPGLAYLRGDMQIAHMIHIVAAVLIISVFALHIYLGTIGLKGAYQGMRTGYVDEGWAHEHHSLWLDDVRAGRIPAQRSAVGAGTASPLQTGATRA
jgi:formate dehydrogenase subunit gamma